MVTDLVLLAALEDIRHQLERIANALEGKKGSAEKKDPPKKDKRPIGRVVRTRRP